MINNYIYKLYENKEYVTKFHTTDEVPLGRLKCLGILLYNLRLLGTCQIYRQNPSIYLQSVR